MWKCPVHGKVSDNDVYDVNIGDEAGPSYILCCGKIADEDVCGEQVAIDNDST